MNICVCTVAPEYLLCLQNGKFDQPNRLFHKISRTWENVNTDHADVKELIPEFYQPPGDFLLNLQNLDLGVRTDGVRVNDVILPPWAKSAEDFTTKLQAALECDYVSSHLHHWIDLFFGYKQRGEEALKADNSSEIQRNLLPLSYRSRSLVRLLNNSSHSLTREKL
jgi:factor associated with neutral sphingomyelinase activation